MNIPPTERFAGMIGLETLAEAPAAPSTAIKITAALPARVTPSVVTIYPPNTAFCESLSTATAIHSQIEFGRRQKPDWCPGARFGGQHAMNRIAILMLATAFSGPAAAPAIRYMATSASISAISSASNWRLHASGPGKLTAVHAEGSDTDLSFTIFSTRDRCDLIIDRARPGIRSCRPLPGRRTSRAIRDSGRALRSAEYAPIAPFRQTPPSGSAPRIPVRRPAG